MKARSLRMFVFAAIALFLNSGFSDHSFAQSWYGTPGWLYRKAITIDHTQVGTIGNTDQSNFPVLVSLSIDPTHAQSTGQDILFTASDGTTKLSYQRDQYSGGTMVAWVKIQTLSHSLNTIIYMYYGNSSATDQQDRVATWDANYQAGGVYHLAEASSPSANSSVAGSTPQGTWVGSPVQGTGEIGKGLTFNGSTNYDDVSSTFGLGAGTVTMECWANLGSLSLRGSFIKIGAGDGYAIGVGATGPSGNFDANGNQIIALYEAKRWIPTGTNFSPTGWHHFALVIDGSGFPRVYYDGASIYNDAVAAPFAPTGGNTYIGGYSTRLFSGTLDEVRISNSVRSADWIVTEYNNQKPSSNFVTAGSEEGPASYAWNHSSGSFDWQDPNNWNPARSSPQPTDVLYFNGGTVTVTNVPSQTIGGLILSNSSSVSLTSSSLSTLTVNAALSTTANDVINFGSGVVLAGSLSNIVNNGKIQTAVTGSSPPPIPTNLIWSGTGTIEYNGAGQTISYGTYNNLTISGSGTKILGGSTTVNGALTVSAGVTLDLSTFNLGSPTSLALQNGLTASTITGSGTLTLGGDVGVSFSGGTGSGATISCPVALNGASRTFTVADETTSATDLIISSVISGIAGITKAGAGTMFLSNSNSYTGTTTINAGIIQLGSAGVGANTPLGTTGAGTTVFGTGAALDLNGFTLATAEALTLNGTGVSNGGALMNSGAAATYSGLITLGSASSIVSTGDIIISNSGTITGATFGLTLGGTGTASSIASIIGTTTGIVTKSGTGTWTLSGASTYTGLTTISAGKLKLGAVGSGSNTPLGTTGSGTTVSATNAALDLNGFTLATIEPLTLNGTGVSSGGALMNSGAAAATYSGLITLGSASSIVSTGDIIISNSGTITGATFGLTLDGTGTASSIASIIGTTTGTVTKSGTGTWTLSGASTYTGLTTISAGILKLGAAGSGANTPLGTTGAGTTVSGNGAALDLNGFTLATAEPLTLNGTGVSSGGALMNSGAAATYSGSITLGSAGSIVSTGDIIISNSGTITGATFGLTLGGTGTASSIASIIGTTTGTVTKSGTGTWTLSGASTYTGATTVNGGRLKAGVATSAFGSGSAVTLADASGVILDLNNNNNTIGSLTGGAASSVTLGSGILTVGNASNTVFAGVISGTTGGIVKSGTGTLTLSGGNTYTGGTTISAGVLTLGAANVLADAGAVTLAGGSLSTNGFAEIMGNLVLTGNSIINLATGSNYSLTFSGASGWTANKTLSINGWQGTYGGGTSGTAGKIFTTAAITTQLPQIRFFNGTNNYNATQIGTGPYELIPAATLSNTGFISVQTGFWDDPATWGYTGTPTPGLNYPGSADNVTVSVSNTVTLEVANVSTTGALTVNGTFALAGLNMTAGALTGAATGIISSSGTSVLTVGDNNNTTFSGIISTGISLVKNGTGMLTLSGTNTYTGSTTVNVGTLQTIKTATPVQNGTFELPGIGGNTYILYTSMSGPQQSAFIWTGTGLTYLINNSTAWGYTIPYPSPSQAVSLQQTCTLGQNIYLLAGTCMLNWYDAQRGGQVNPYNIQLDGVNLPGSPFSASSNSWTLRNITLTVSTTGNHTITFVGLTSGTDLSVGIDNVSLTNVSTIVLPNTTALSIAGGATVDLAGNSQQVGSLAGAGTVTSSVTGQVTLTTGNGTSTTFSGLIRDGSGTMSLTKNGTGTFTLSGNNTYSGLTAINAGIIQLGAAGVGANTPLGTTGAGTIVSANNAALDLNGFTLVTAEPLTLNGTGVSNGGALMNSGAAATYSGLITLGSASSIVSTGDIIISNSGTITGATFGLTLGGTGTASSIASIIGTTTGTVTISGGTWTLSGNSTYTGLTTISAGTLKLGAAGISPNGPLGTTGAGTTVAATNAALDLNNITLATAEPLTLNGTGVSGGGALVNSASTGSGVTYSGAITLGSASSIGTTIASTGNITLGGGITGSKDLTKVGAGTLTLGSSTATLNGLTISNGTLTSTSGTMNLAGNFLNNSVFNPSTGTVNFNGSSSQSIGSVATSFNNLTISNASGITLNTNISVNGTTNALTFTSGKITTGTNTLSLASGVTVSGGGTLGWVIGRLAWNIPTGTPIRTFYIGDANNYTPVAVNFASVTVNGTLTGYNTVGDHPQIAGSGISSTKSVNRYWTLANAGITFTSATVTPTWVAGDVDAGASTASFIAAKYDNPVWTNPSASGQTATSLVINGITSFSDFQVGNCAYSSDPIYAAASNNPICSGTSTTLTLNGGNGGGLPESIKWYTGTCGGTLAGTGNNLLVSPTSQTTYYGRYEDAAPCTGISNCAQVIVMIAGSGCSATTLTQPAQLVSGAPSADQTLCYGETPSQLSAAVPAGGVGPFSYLWQIYNTGTSAWDDIGGATSLTYSPGALTVTTRYRLKQTDTYCTPNQVVYTNEITITVNALQSVSGAFTYYNTANTPLSGSDYTVKLYRSSDNALMGTINPVVSGHYSFTGLCPDRNYYIVATSAHTTAGSVNTTDAAQDNFWGVSPSSIEKVRFYAGDVTGDPPFFISSADAQLIQSHFVNGTPFGKGTWNFWRVGETISNNSSPTDTYPTVNLPVGSGATADMYGLCAGDFNRSFDPSLSKSASSTLNLIYSGNSEVSGNQEFDLPVHIVKASTVGAVSLILNFPTDLMEVKDVVLNGAGGQLDWAVKGNELRIGWHSMNPLRFEANTELLTLKLKSTDAFTKGNLIRLSLAADPLNELADDQYHVIGDAVLSVDVISASPVGIEEQTPVNGLTLSNHPNPFNSYTIFEYSLPFDGKVTLEIHNLLGVTEKILVNEKQASGCHSLKFDAGSLPSGIYTATIRLRNDSDMLVRTIKLVSNR